MSSSEGVRLGHVAGPAESRWLIKVVSALLLLAKPGEGAWGGNNKTEFVMDFPWIFVLFRNPAAEYYWPLDGYQAGFALEIMHNLFLINDGSAARASNHVDGLNWQLMAAKRARDLVYIDPNKSEWPPDGQPGLGNLTLLTTVGMDFSLYRLHPYDNSTYWPPWPIRPSPPIDALKGMNPRTHARRYPIWNEDKNLKSNCYVYTFYAPDWEDVLNKVVSFNIQRNIYGNREDRFYVNDTRSFARWPVKMVESSDQNAYRFVFDEARYWEEHNVGKYMATRARACAGWQDVGAPIMCGDDAPWYKGYSERGIYYERQYLKLSYVVKSVRQDPAVEYDNKRNWTGECWYSLMATRLADHTRQVKPIVNALKWEYFAHFKRRAPAFADDEVFLVRREEPTSKIVVGF